MGKELFEKYGIRQLGYSVESIEETAQLYHDLFGAGPFIDMGVNAPESCKIRGVEQPVRMRTAIGYLGDMEIELIEDKSDCPSPYSEAGRYGGHRRICRRRHRGRHGHGLGFWDARCLC